MELFSSHYELKGASIFTRNL